MSAKLAAIDQAEHAAGVIQSEVWVERMKWMMRIVKKNLIWCTMKI